jgi:hypothetical protein
LRGDGEKKPLKSKDLEGRQKMVLLSLFLIDQEQYQLKIPGIVF